MIGGRASLAFGDAGIPPVYAADGVRREVLEWLPKLAMKRGLDLSLLLALFQLLPITWANEAQYQPREKEARGRMRERDEDEWPTVGLALALAQSHSVSIWTNDKDFSIAGVGTVTSGELLDLLRRRPGR